MKLYRNIHKKDLDVNLTPLIDVILLLIIFFMMVSQITRTEAEPLTLPEAERASDIDQETSKRVIVSVRRDGQRVLFGEPVSLEQVLALLREEKAQRGPEAIRVLIRADAEAPWRAIEQVVGLCRDEGLLRVRVAVTKKNEG